MAEQFPFAGVGTDSPFGLVNSNAGHRANLPKRRFPAANKVENGYQDSPSVNGLNSVEASSNMSPFECVTAPQGGPFEPFFIRSFRRLSC